MSLAVQLSVSDWLAFFNHFLSLSLLAVGGAIITAPDMHRFLVDEHQWLSEQQFSSSIALAQSAPGPNVLFVALIGWNVGLNAGSGLGGGWFSVGLSALGVVMSLLGIMLPSSILTYNTTRWAQRHRDKLGVRAFTCGHCAAGVHRLVAHCGPQPAHERLAAVAAHGRGHAAGLAHPHPFAVVNWRRRCDRRVGLDLRRQGCTAPQRGLSKNTVFE